MRSRLFAPLALVALCTVPAAQAQPGGSSRILGTWHVTISSEEGETLPARWTFVGGQTENEGSFQVATPIDTTPPAQCGAATGVWKRTGVRRFAITWEQWCPNDGSNPEDPTNYFLTGIDEITVNGKGDALTGLEHLHGVDFVTGDDLFEVDFGIAGTRMTVQPAPDAGAQSAPATGTKRWLKSPGR